MKNNGSDNSDEEYDDEKPSTSGRRRSERRKTRRDVPSHDEPDREETPNPGRYHIRCQVCGGTFLKKTMIELPQWWERLLVLLALYYDHKFGREELSIKYKASHKIYLTSKIKNGGKSFHICRKHLAQLARTLLRRLRCENYMNLEEIPEETVNEAIHLLKTVEPETCKKMKRKHFLTCLNQFISYDFPRLQELIPPIEEIVNRREDVDDEQMDTSDEQVDVSEESVQNLNVFELEDDSLYQDNSADESKENVPEIMEVSVAPSSSEDEREDDSIERTYERQSSPSNSSGRSTAIPFDSASSSTPTKSDEQTKKTKKLRECKICGTRVKGIDLSGEWSKRLVIYTALKDRLITQNDVFPIINAGNRTYICYKHAFRTAEFIFGVYRVMDFADFETFREASEISSSLDPFTIEVCEVFHLYEYPTVDVIKQARHFILTHGKEVTIDDAMIEEVSRLFPTSQASPNVTPSSSFVSCNSPSSVDSSKEPTSSSSTSQALSSESPSKSKQQKKRRCQICDKSCVVESLYTFTSAFNIFCMLATLHFEKQWEEETIKELYNTKLKLPNGPKLFLCFEHVREAGPDMMRYLKITDTTQANIVSFDETEPLKIFMRQIDSAYEVPADFGTFINKCMEFVKKCREKSQPKQ